jgi:hypothetical protein
LGVAGHPQIAPGVVRPPPEPYVTSRPWVVGQPLLRGGGVSFFPFFLFEKKKLKKNKK